MSAEKEFLGKEGGLLDATSPSGEDRRKRGGRRERSDFSGEFKNLKKPFPEGV